MLIRLISQIGVPPCAKKHRHGRVLLQILCQRVIAGHLGGVACLYLFGDGGWQEGGGCAGYHQQGIPLAFDQLFDKTDLGNTVGVPDQHAVGLAVLCGSPEKAGVAGVELHRVPFEAALVQVCGVVVGDDGIEFAAFFRDPEAQVVGNADSGLNRPDGNERAKHKHHKGLLQAPGPVSIAILHVAVAQPRDHDHACQKCDAIPGGQLHQLVMHECDWRPVPQVKRVGNAAEKDHHWQAQQSSGDRARLMKARVDHKGGTQCRPQGIITGEVIMFGEQQGGGNDHGQSCQGQALRCRAG